MGYKPGLNNNYSVVKYESTISIRSCLLFALLVHHIFALGSIFIASKTKVDEETQRKLAAHIHMGFRFMTIWNFLGQIVYLITELSLLFLPNKKLTPVIKQLSWLNFTTFIWPTSIFITTVFWGIYNVDREWILPKIADVFLPLHLNHCVHTVILVLHVVEFFTTTHQSMPNLHLMQGLNFAYMMIYAFVLNGTFIFDNIWIYPFFEWLTWPQRFAVYVLTFLAAQLLLKLGYIMLEYRCNQNILKYKHE